MDDLINTIRKYERLIFIALPILMAAIFAFLPIADVLGKATGNGLKVIFDGKGLGFGRICAALALLLPIAAAVLQFVKVNLPAQVETWINVIWTGASVVFVVLMAIAFPEGVSLAWGGYVYCLLAIIGIVIDLMPSKNS